MSSTLRNAQRAAGIRPALLPLPALAAGVTQADAPAASPVARRALIDSALAAARTLDEELRALVIDQPERNAQAVFALWQWGAPEGVPVSPERTQAIFHWTRSDVAAVFGVGRERVRQLVDRAEARLRAMHAERPFTMPCVAATLQVLDAAGGALPTDQWLAACAAHGVAATRAGLMALPALASLEIAPPVMFDHELLLWISPAGRRARLRLSGRTRESRPTIQRHGRRLVRTLQLAFLRTGGISGRRLQRLTPFGVHHAMRRYLGPDAGAIADDGTVTPRRYVVAGGWLLRATQEDTGVSGVADKIVAAAGGPVPFPDLIRGLRKARTPTAGRWSRTPAAVVAAVLARHPGFVLEDAGGIPRTGATPPLRHCRVRHVTPRPLADVCSPLEVAIVERVRARGGAVRLGRLAADLLAAGWHGQVAGVARMSPITVRPCYGVLTVRGVVPPPDVLRAAQAEVCAVLGARRRRAALAEP